MLTRVITAVVLMAILIASIYVGPLAFAGVMAVAFGITLYEWLRIAKLDVKSSLLIAVVETVAQYSLFVVGVIKYLEWPLFIFTGLVLLVWFVIFFATLFCREKGFQVSQRQCLITAVTFVPAAYLSFLWLYSTGDWILVLSVLMIVWGADTFAYFSGRRFGKHRMAPAISPKKTWEGALGAYVAVIVFFLIAYAAAGDAQNVFTTFVFTHIGVLWGLLVLAGLVSLSIAGDLWESMLKRLAGIKDSSNLLPGHGGFFDRLDASLSVLPAAVFIMLWIKLLVI